MAAITYPAALPAPQAPFPFVLRDRRAASPQPGMQQLRTRARAQVIDAKGVRWFYTPAQMDTWRDWFENTLLLGQQWFAVSLPGRGGWQQRVARYVDGTVRDHKGAGFFVVTADLEISGSRVAPQESVPAPHICWETDPGAFGVTFPSHTTCFSTPEEAVAADMEFLGGAESGFTSSGCYVDGEGQTFCTTHQVIPGVGTVTTETPMHPRWET